MSCKETVLFSLDFDRTEHFKLSSRNLFINLTFMRTLGLDLIRVDERRLSTQYGGNRHRSTQPSTIKKYGFF